MGYPQRAPVALLEAELGINHPHDPLLRQVAAWIACPPTK